MNQQENTGHYNTCYQQTSINIIPISKIKYIVHIWIKKSLWFILGIGVHKLETCTLDLLFSLLIADLT